MKKPQMPKLQGLGLPKKLRPGGKSRPKTGGSQVRAPKLLTDLYGDMRDRRLLGPAIALLVALVAVPLLLSGSSEPAVPPPLTSTADTEEAAAVQSAVLVEEVGIRDYKERLAALRETNPFAQKFTLPASGGGGAGDGSGGTTETSTTESTSSSTTSSSTSVTETSVSTETTGGGVSSPQIDETTVDETTVEEPKPEIRFYAGRVDVTVGQLGKAKRVKDVRYLDFLPGEKSPVVAFIGLREGAERAVFSVSSDVAETSGEGSCAPKKPSPCQFLTLKIGEQHKFKFADGRTYRLRLLNTHVVRVPDPRNETTASGDG